jgi:hypothetical protein
MIAGRSLNAPGHTLMIEDPKASILEGTVLARGRGIRRSYLRVNEVLRRLGQTGQPRMVQKGLLFQNDSLL